MADGRSRYYNFDPGQYFAQTQVESPSYNPFSPNPNFLGGIRKTINSIWAFREMQREQEDERKRMEFESRLNEREMELRERKATFEEETTKAEAEERRKNNLWKRYEEIFQTPYEDKVTLTAGGRRVAEANGYDPDSLRDPGTILKMNQGWLSQVGDIAEGEKRKAKDVVSAKKAGDTGFLTYHLKDVNAKIEKLVGIQPAAEIPNPRYDKSDPKKMKKAGILPMMPNSEVDDLAFQLEALRKTKDMLEGVSARSVEEGGELSLEDKANILSLTGDSHYWKLYNKNISRPQILASLDMGLSPREVNKLYSEWQRAGGEAKAPFDDYLMYYLEEGRK